jgi:alkylation response protein AidB-like acyl-CoA dehydrogenase
MTVSTVRDPEEFRHHVRQWCAENVPADWRERQTGVSHDEFVAFQQAWLQTLRRGDFAVPHWPKEWGGGLSARDEAILFEELARADAPRLVLHFVSLHHAASTLLTAGSDDQRARHLPAILDGEVWCQGFSEPNAGSDLASLRTAAIREGDDYVVNGQKIWASLAMYADWCLLLARTDPEAPKRRGISYFLMDMRSPGVDVRPIQNAAGEAHFCEIFLTDVRIPAGNLIGPENDGWRVAQSTLNSERGGTMVELAERLGNGYRWLIDLARTRPDPQGRPYSEDGMARDRIAHLGSQLRSLRLMCARITDDTVGQDAGVLASVIKLYYSELLQDLTGYGVELAGLDAQLEAARPLSAGWESGHWLLDYIGSWEWTIPGGTSEIQRNIIGERGLGLPREPVAS